jgi:protein-L-isoaspartate(D-aspartate) O-methyltransferase
MSLVEDLVKNNWLKSERIISAFKAIKREDFLPEEIKNLNSLNEALPIGQGQTISQPLVVAFMLELLQPLEGNKVLDIGAGSGWTAALLARIVGPAGKVIALEIIPELKRFGESNVSKYSFIKSGVVEFIRADGRYGWPEESPFDRILVSASGKSLLPAWKKQLKEKGRIVAPIGNSIWLFEKGLDKKLKSRQYPGFAFVPLVGGQ